MEQISQDQFKLMPKEWKITFSSEESLKEISLRLNFKFPEY
jgi:ribosome-associated toxin RatA of RatAB toxin-antitoxin module